MDKIKVKIKRIHEDAIIPRYQSIGASGFDLHALEDVAIPFRKIALVKTGLTFEIPEGYELQIRPRSGLSLKTGLRVANSPGTIDADYRGEVCIILEHTEIYTNEFYNENSGKSYDEVFHYIKKGDRIAQGVICPVFQAEFVEEELTDTERGAGGFGHSGA